MGLNSSSIEDHAQSEEECFHVLAVDDNLIDRKLLERLLKSSSYHVTCVESGDKALKYLGVYDECSTENENNSNRFYGAANYTSSSSSSSSSTLQQEKLKVNLIMTDFSMPGMSGYDLLTLLKKSRWKDVPVVVMSSENIPSRINMCLEGGAKEFLLKPLQLSDLDKIQPYLLKSSHQEFTNIAKKFNVNIINHNNITTKRKAVVALSPQPYVKRSKSTKINCCFTL